MAEGPIASSSRMAPGSGAGAGAGGRAFPPSAPSRSMTMDERQYGGLPQQRTYDRMGQLEWPDQYSPPNRAALYNQANHSSPSLAATHQQQGLKMSSNSNAIDYTDLAASQQPTAVDDINLRLERMQFDQRNSVGSAGSNHGFASAARQPSPHGSIGRSGVDGAIEIRGGGDQGQTASVYSLDYNPAAIAQQQYARPTEDRRLSDGSVYHDDHYREIPQNYAAAGGNGSADDHLSNPAYLQYQQQSHQQFAGAQAWYGATAAQDPYGGSVTSTSPPFSPQPSHGSWPHSSTASAAAVNPYYAAATGQLGFPGDSNSNGQPGYLGSPYGLSRATSTTSSMSGPSPMMLGGAAPIGRSQSMLSVPPGSGPPPSVRRQPTGSSGKTSSSGYSGPPITKQSVDEYRNRIKADPDPEAQFNFAKYLIEAAKKISSGSTGDEKSAKKYRDALLAESLKLIKRLATQGSGLGKPAYADAQFFLANCLGNGSLGLQVDHEKAYNLYVQASKQNHPAATYRTAVCNEVGAGTRRDHARAVLFYRKASALGDTAGMYKLGMILLNGLLGQQRNPKEAIAWLKRAAAQADDDNPHALHELGLLYERAPPPGQPSPLAGHIVQDHAQARELFTQAAQLGYPPSQFKLGACYEYGSLTCPVDPRRSIAWYTRAAERGDAESELALSGWYLTGSDGVLKQSDSEAYLWARRAANKGLPKAEYAVGYYSEVGIGVRQDIEEAKRWYMRAAAQGNKRAMQRLTELKKIGQTRGTKVRPTRQQAEKECVIM